MKNLLTGLLLEQMVTQSFQIRFLIYISRTWYFYPVLICKEQVTCGLIYPIIQANDSYRYQGKGKALKEIKKKRDDTV